MPPKPPLRAPELTLAQDSGLTGDALTRNGQIKVSGLEEGASWTFSLDEGVTWRAGSGSDIPDDLFEGDGAKVVLAKQHLDGATTSLVGRLDFVLDRTPSSTPRVDHRPSTLMNRETAERAEAFVVIGNGADEPGLLHWQTDGDLSDHSGASRLEVPIDALGGAGALTYWHVDDAGNVSEKGVLPVDVVPPAKLTVQAVHPAMRVSEDSIPMHAGDLKILGLEPDAGWRYRIDDGEWTDGQGDTLSDEALRRPGKHVILLMHVDAHGNESDVHHVPIEVAGPLRLSLKNDTGDTPEQRADGITSDATVQVLGIGQLHGAVQYRIDAGSWRALGDGKIIGSSEFDGDGRKRVEVRPLDANDQPLQALSLEFQVDSVSPSSLRLRVMHERAKVNELGIPAPGAEYSLTNRAQVVIPDLEEGASWSATQVDRGGKGAIGSPVEGTSEQLPTTIFKEGPQIIAVNIRDRAGNAEKTVRLEFIWLDTTPPPTPEWSVLEEAPGTKRFLLKSPERDAHFEHRPDASTAWRRVGKGEELTGPHEIRQVDLAGNVSVESNWLTANQVLLAPLIH